MPSPYQREVFGAPHSDGRMQIRVLCCAQTEHDCNWSIPALNPYEEVLPSKTIGWLGPSAHFNPGIIKILREDTSDLFLSDYSVLTTQYLTWRGKPWVFCGEIPGLQSAEVGPY